MSNDDQDDKTLYKVAAPYVTLQHEDRFGSKVITGFYQGAPVPASADEATVQRLLDKGMLIRVDDPVADIIAVPAGTPMPGEPPNVPVAEVPDTSLESRYERARESVKATAGRGRAGAAEPDGKTEQPPQKAEPPAVSASKGEWVDYAVAQGEDRGKAEAMSKEQLVGKHGRRA